MIGMSRALYKPEPFKSMKNYITMRILSWIWFIYNC